MYYCDIELLKPPQICSDIRIQMRNAFFSYGRMKMA